MSKIQKSCFAAVQFLSRKHWNDVEKVYFSQFNMSHWIPRPKYIGERQQNLIIRGEETSKSQKFVSQQSAVSHFKFSNFEPETLE